MRRIDERTVELTDTESEAKNQHDALLDLGESTVEATYTVYDHFGDQLTDEFYLYLSDGQPLPWK